MIKQILLALLLCSTPVFAQTQVRVGMEGGSSFGNLYAGPRAEVLIPFAKHYELDLKDTFSPFENHVKLGSGSANYASGEGIYWINKKIGLDGALIYSTYQVPGVNKKTPYAAGGVVAQPYSDVRFTFNYVREFANGISKNGTESDHVQAGDINLEVGAGCSGKVCYVLAFDFQIGHVLTQSNPVCDGTFGITGGNGPNGTCYRTGAMSGGAYGAFMVEFPRRR